MAHGWLLGNPLAKKLGINVGCRLVILNAPQNLELNIPADVKAGTVLSETVDVIPGFFREFDHLEATMDEFAAAIFPAGGLWVVWPKAASRQATDINADLVRKAAFRRHLIDNKVCAIDETWTALRVVWRVEHRRVT